MEAKLPSSLRPQVASFGVWRKMKTKPKEKVIFVGDWPSKVGRLSAMSEPAARAATLARARELTRVDALAERAQRVAMRRVGSTLTELRKASVALHEAEDEALEVRRHAAGQRH